MGVRIPADYALATVWGLVTGDQEEMAWTFGLSIGSAGSVSDLPTLIETAWTTNIKGLFSSVYTRTRVTVKVGPTATGPTYESNTHEAGSDGGALLPPNCAVLVKKHTLLGGRRGRGRMYLPGVSEISGTLDSAGTFSLATAAGIAAAMEDFRNDIETDGTIGPAPWVLLHEDLTTPSPIDALTCPNKIATQRRRLRP